MTISLPAAARLSPAAEEFIAAWGISIEREPAASSQASGAGGEARDHGAASEPRWKKPASFPVRFTETTAGYPKREHETQLNPHTFVPKNSPRIRLRGKLDTLHAICLLTGSLAAQHRQQRLLLLIETLAAYIRELLSAEYHERPPAPLEIDGRDEAALRAATHQPQQELGTPHVVASSTGSPLMLHLNYLRCLARETELYALDAYAPTPGSTAQQPRMIEAMNRLSSAVYYIELVYQAGQA